MVLVETEPSAIVLPGNSGFRKPAKPTDRHDVRALIQIGLGALVVCPVGIEQQPCQRMLLEVQDHRMQQIATPWRVFNYSVRTAEIGYSQGIRPMLDVRCENAFEADSLQRTDQMPIAATWGRKGIETVDKRAKSFNRPLVSRLISIMLAAWEIRALRHASTLHDV